MKAHSSTFPLHERVESSDDKLLVPLFRKLHDSVTTFTDLAGTSHIKEHQHLARRRIAQRQELLRELRLELQQVSSEPADGSLIGMWQHLRKDVSALFPNAERKMLDIALQNEQALRAAYTQVLEGNPQSINLRDTLHRQQTQVSQSIAELHILQKRA